MNGRTLALIAPIALMACADPSEPGGSLEVTVEADSPATRGETLRESVGIETSGGEMTPILEAGCRLPCEERVRFGTFEDDQREIVIYLFRGNTSATRAAHSLGVWEIAGLPPAPAGSRDVAVTFRASADGISLVAEPLDGASIGLRPAQP